MKSSILMVVAALAVTGTASAPPKAAGSISMDKTAPGRVVFDRWCSSCHGPGREFPGTGALEAKYKGELPGELLKRTDLNPEIVRFFVRNGISVMPFFRKTEISDPELEALANYLSKNRVK